MGSRLAFSKWGKALAIKRNIIKVATYRGTSSGLVRQMGLIENKWDCSLNGFDRKLTCSTNNLFVNMGNGPLPWPVNNWWH